MNEYIILTLLNGKEIYIKKDDISDYHSYAAGITKVYFKNKPFEIKVREDALEIGDKLHGYNKCSPAITMSDYSIQQFKENREMLHKIEIDIQEMRDKWFAAFKTMAVLFIIALIAIAITIRF
jgi:hypothetical protein